MADNQKIDQHILNKYKVIKKIGSGAYGHVWKISSPDKPSEVIALKKIFQAFQHATDAQRTFREISILKKMNHANIIKLYDIMPSQSGRDIYLLFEYMNTDLYHIIYQGHIEDVHKKYILYQLLLGLHYLHSSKLVHRDLKPSNLLLNEQCQLKICDFGLVRHLDMGKNEEVVMTEGVATRWYRAPEILLGSQKYDEKADIWSVGCILAQMVLKNPLFGCNSTIAQIQKILQVIGKPSVEQIAETNSQIALSVIKQCGSIRQKTIKQVFGPGSDETCIDLIFKLLKFSGSKRLTALQALKHPYLKEFFKESDLIPYKGQIVLETNDNIKLTTEAYKQLITKHFIQKKQSPHRFSDLRKVQKSFGKVLSEINNRRASGQKDPRNGERKNVHLFQEILRQKQNSAHHNRVIGKSSSKKEKEKIQDKENLSTNPNGNANLQKFDQTKNGKVPGTFSALRKVNTNVKFTK